MRVACVLATLATLLVISNAFQLRYPGVLLCGEPSKMEAVTASGMARQCANGAFKQMETPNGANYTLTDGVKDVGTVYCYSWTADGVAQADDPYSVVVFNISGTDMTPYSYMDNAVEYVVLVDPMKDPRTTNKVLDIYTDLIYVYYAHALVTITEQLSVMGDFEYTFFSNSLHSTSVEAPPQIIWVKYDVGWFTNGTGIGCGSSM